MTSKNAALRTGGSTLSPAVKRMVHSASRTGGRATHRLRVLPDFLIVGAQRSGTTSMYRTLSQHPAVLKAVLHKGVHYFDVGYSNGPAWYRGHFPLERSARRVERELGVRALSGESSPYYMFHPLAAERIAHDLPSVRLLVLLRDPVERAYSAHAHELARGYETEPSFEHALELEEVRTAGEGERVAIDPDYHSHNHQHLAYLARGRYAQQLDRLERLVCRDRIHVVDSQDFFEEPESTYRKVLSFLGVPEMGQPIFDQYNARPRAAMPQSLRGRLEQHFKPYDESLVDWLGAIPSWRR